MYLHPNSDFLYLNFVQKYQNVKLIYVDNLDFVQNIPFLNKTLPFIKCWPNIKMYLKF